VARLEGLAGFSLESGEMDLDGIDDADLEVCPIPSPRISLRFSGVGFGASTYKVLNLGSSPSKTWTVLADWWCPELDL
jgi:hypothetical protein